MTERQWRISVFTAMLRYGEGEVTALLICGTAALLFPGMAKPVDPWLAVARFELGECRKRLKFRRAAAVENRQVPPTIGELLMALTGKVRHGRKSLPSAIGAAHCAAPPLSAG